MILCGGAGERLWPASRPWRPKPFLALVGQQTPFQAAALRAAALVSGGGRVVVVAGVAHADLIATQLAEVHVEAAVLTEREGRDTAPAIAAAADWVAARAPEAVVAVLPADHHIPDLDAFAAAVRVALPVAEQGRIVTLGVRPTYASSAYGYIRPGEGDGAVKPIDAFVEKPPAAAAEALLAEGALWNCGVFVASARTFLDEVARHAPLVASAAARSLRSLESPDHEAQGLLNADGMPLGLIYADAPKIAFDRAVMEKTDLGAVLPVDLAWSDLGTWDAVLAADPRAGAAPGVTIANGERVMARVAPTMRVVVNGVSDVAVIAEPDGVLVTALTASGAVRDVAFGPSPPFARLEDAAAWFDTWLRTAALPLWATVGTDPRTGAFREALTWDGRIRDPRRRTRVQARQAFVFASAAADGVPGPWLDVAQRGYAWFLANAKRADGLFVSALDAPGGSGEEDPEARLYEHAFALLAFWGLRRAGGRQVPAEDPVVEAANDLLRRVVVRFGHSAGGLREIGDAPFQANAQMHVLEALIAGQAAGGIEGALALMSDIVGLALDRFIDPVTGALREFFDADWQALGGDQNLIEPGHQFEWAWLLHRFNSLKRSEEVAAAARRLFDAGRRGFDPVRGVIQNALWDDLSVRDAGARLWPQTEHLKAALVLGETEAALQAANSLVRYLDTPAHGVWRERMRPDGGFIDEPSPATSLYHLYLAIRELVAHAGPS